MLSGVDGGSRRALTKRKGCGPAEQLWIAAADGFAPGIKASALALHVTKHVRGFHQQPVSLGCPRRGISAAREIRLGKTRGPMGVSKIQPRGGQLEFEAITNIDPFVTVKAKHVDRFEQPRAQLRAVTPRQLLPDRAIDRLTQDVRQRSQHCWPTA
jgi:hypothetical protein